MQWKERKPWRNSEKLATLGKQNTTQKSKKMGTVRCKQSLLLIRHPHVTGVVSTYVTQANTNNINKTCYKQPEVRQTEHRYLAEIVMEITTPKNKKVDPY